MGNKTSIDESIERGKKLTEKNKPNDKLIPAYAKSRYSMICKELKIYTEKYNLFGFIRTDDIVGIIADYANTSTLTVEKSDIGKYFYRSPCVIEKDFYFDDEKCDVYAMHGDVMIRYNVRDMTTIQNHIRHTHFSPIYNTFYKKNNTVYFVCANETNTIISRVNDTSNDNFTCTVEKELDYPLKYPKYEDGYIYYINSDKLYREKDDLSEKRLLVDLKCLTNMINRSSLPWMERKLHFALLEVRGSIVYLKYTEYSESDHIMGSFVYMYNVEDGNFTLMFEANKKSKNYLDFRISKIGYYLTGNKYRSINKKSISIIREKYDPINIIDFEGNNKKQIGGHTNNTHIIAKGRTKDVIIQYGSSYIMISSLETK